MQCSTRSFLWLALVTGLLAPVLLASSPSLGKSQTLDVYVNKKPLKCDMYRAGGDVFVDVEALGRALSLPCTVDRASRSAQLGGKQLQPVVLRGRVAFVSLREVARLLGGRYLEQNELGIYDLVTFKAPVDPSPLGRATPATAGPTVSFPTSSVLLDPQAMPGIEGMPYIFDLCKRQLKILLGMDITVPVDPIYEPQRDISRRHSDAVGYAEPTVITQDGIPVRMEIHIPYDCRGALAAHIMAHELTHCWERQEKMQMTSKPLYEGFAEWAASEVLRSLGMMDEIRTITDPRRPEEYREGYKYIVRLSEKMGPIKTVEFFRNHRYGEKRDNF